MRMWIPLDELYRICQITRDKVCIDDYYVGRIIARPFVGELGSFVRTSNRHDYSRMPEKKMVQQELQDAGCSNCSSWENWRYLCPCWME